MFLQLVVVQEVVEQGWCVVVVSPRPPLLRRQYPRRQECLACGIREKSQSKILLQHNPLPRLPRKQNANSEENLVKGLKKTKAQARQRDPVNCMAVVGERMLLRDKSKVGELTVHGNKPSHVQETFMPLP